MLDDIIFIDNLPSIDLHGFDRDSARVATNDFIKDNIKMHNRFIVIIHGQGSHIVRDEVHKSLKNNYNVHAFKLFNYNTGCTIVELKLV